MESHSEQQKQLFCRHNAQIILLLQFKITHCLQTLYFIYGDIKTIFITGILLLMSQYAVCLHCDFTMCGWDSNGST